LAAGVQTETTVVKRRVQSKSQKEITTVEKPEISSAVSVEAHRTPV